MNQRDLARVLFATVGVLIAGSRLTDWLWHLSTLLHMNPEVDDPFDPISAYSFSLLGFVIASINIFLGLAIVIFRNRLANVLFADSPISSQINEFQAVAFSILGCYFAIGGISRIWNLGGVDWNAVAHAVLGIGLFLGARALSTFWSYTRSLGRHRSKNESAT